MKNYIITYTNPSENKTRYKSNLFPSIESGNFFNFVEKYISDDDFRYELDSVSDNTNYKLVQSKCRNLPDEHLFLTYDFEYYDYKLDGHDIDDRTMKDYYRKEADNKRFKTVSSPLEIVSLESFIESKEKISKKDNVKLGNIITFLFGKSKENPNKKNGTFRKISPSGGARHPSEHYLIVFNDPELSSGVYHYNWGLNELHLINKNLPENETNESCRVVITSMHERNRYRYREPRTFRTLFIDVGHVIGNVEIISKYLGLILKSTPILDKIDYCRSLHLKVDQEMPIYEVRFYNGN